MQVTADVVTHLASGALATVAFWWRWESTQKRWTKERFSVLIVTLLAAAWNFYMAWWKATDLTSFPILLYW